MKTILMIPIIFIFSSCSHFELCYVNGADVYYVKKNGNEWLYIYAELYNTNKIILTINYHLRYDLDFLYSISEVGYLEVEYPSDYIQYNCIKNKIKYHMNENIRIYFDASCKYQDIRNLHSKIPDKYKDDVCKRIDIIFPLPWWLRVKDSVIVYPKKLLKYKGEYILPDSLIITIPEDS